MTCIIQVVTLRSFVGQKANGAAHVFDGLGMLVEQAGNLSFYGEE